MNDLIKEIIKENFPNKDIVITLPKTIKWSDYEKELDTVKDGKQVMNFKVGHFPKISPGAKCYILHDGFVRGWMTVVKLSEKNFTCSTTGKEWKGKFIERTGKFNKIEPIPMQGFQGFRYFNL